MIGFVCGSDQTCWRVSEELEFRVVEGGDMNGRYVRVVVSDELNEGSCKSSMGCVLAYLVAMVIHYVSFIYQIYASCVRARINTGASHERRFQKWNTHRWESNRWRRYPRKKVGGVVL